MMLRLVSSTLYRRNLILSKSVRAFSSEVKTRQVRENVGGIQFATRSREEFERAFPQLASKQEHHLRMLREYRLPVHRSGGSSDDMANYMFYGATGVMMVYTFYLFYMLITTS